MDNEKLDLLLNELKRTKTSVDFKKFCDSKWGKSNETFKNSRLLAQTITADGYAEYSPNNNNLLILTGKGDGFQGYIQAELTKATLENDSKDLDNLRMTNLLLTNEKLVYESTIRQLEERLKISTLLKNLWWLIGAAIALGVAIGKFI